MLVLLLLNLVNYGYYPQYFVQQYLRHLLDVGDCSAGDADAGDCDGGDGGGVCDEDCGVDADGGDDGDDAVGGDLLLLYADGCGDDAFDDAGECGGL